MVVVVVVIVVVVVVVVVVVPWGSLSQESRLTQEGRRSGGVLP